MLTHQKYFPVVLQSSWKTVGPKTLVADCNPKWLKYLDRCFLFSVTMRFIQGPFSKIVVIRNMREKAQGSDIATHIE